MKDFSKPLYNEMSHFSQRTGERMYEIYRALIDYMAGFLDYTGHPVGGWKYGQKENEHFQKMTYVAMDCMCQGIEENGWFDLFGDIFMKYLGDKDNRGQCFTPEGMADAAAKIQLNQFDINASRTRCGIFGHMPTINDPSCGSGRLALAAAYLMKKNHDELSYSVCEDIDPICVKQTAINLAIHGYYGEVICHDTLKSPSSLRFGYIVNEGLYPFRDGMPTVRYSEDESCFVATNFWQAKAAATSQKQAEMPKETGIPVQLTLF